MRRVVILLAVVLLSSLSSFARGRGDYGKFDFELGLDMAVAANDVAYSNKVYLPGVYLEGRWQLEEQPIDLGFHLGINVVRRTLDDDFDPFSISGDYDNYILVPLMAVADYQFGRGRRINPYVGLGVGASQNCLISGFDGDSSAWSYVVAPRIGVRCFKTMNIGLVYYLTERDYSRLNVNLGFYF